MKVIILVVALFCSLNLLASPIDSILNKELIVSDGWAGKSFTLLKNKSDAREIRYKIFGSGIPVRSEKYITPSEVKDKSVKFKIDANVFEIRTHDPSKPQVFLNDYELKVKYK